MRRQLEGGERGGFPRKPSNWPAPPARADARQWAADVALLRQEHALLLEVIATFPPARLARRSPAGKKWTCGELIVGIANHDAYHTGQIQLLKRLQQGRRGVRA